MSSGGLGQRSADFKLVGTEAGEKKINNEIAIAVIARCLLHEINEIKLHELTTRTTTVCKLFYFSHFPSLERP